MIVKDYVRDDLLQLKNVFPFAEDLRNKSVFVTGGTGLLGSLIVRFLDFLNESSGCNIAIYAMARNKEKAEALPVKGTVEWVIQDLKEPVLIESEIDYIFHTASPTQSRYLSSNPVEVILDTVTGAKNVFEFAKKAHATVVYLSSIEIYGQIFDKETVSEGESGFIDHLSPRSCYPEAKKLIECMAASYFAEYGTDIRIARLTQTFGAGVALDDNRVFSQFARSIIKGNDIVLHTQGTSSKSYLYTTDAINAMFYILFRGRPGDVYNVANRKTYISIKGLAHFLIHKFNSSIRLRVEPLDNMGYAPDSKVNLNTDKIEMLGWKPQYGLVEMFSRLINYLEGNEH